MTTTPREGPSGGVARVRHPLLGCPRRVTPTPGAGAVGHQKNGPKQRERSIRTQTGSRTRPRRFPSDGAASASTAPEMATPPGCREPGGGSAHPSVRADDHGSGLDPTRANADARPNERTGRAARLGRCTRAPLPLRWLLEVPALAARPVSPSLSAEPSLSSHCLVRPAHYRRGCPLLSAATPAGTGSPFLRAARWPTVWLGSWSAGVRRFGARWEPGLGSRWAPGWGHPWVPSRSESLGWTSPPPTSATQPRAPLHGRLRHPPDPARGAPWWAAAHGYLGGPDGSTTSSQGPQVRGSGHRAVGPSGLIWTGSYGLYDRATACPARRRFDSLRTPRHLRFPEGSGQGAGQAARSRSTPRRRVPPFVSFGTCVTAATGHR